MDKNQLRSDIFRLWEVQELLSIEYYPLETVLRIPSIKRENLEMVVNLINEEHRLKKRIRKNIWFWKYIHFMLCALCFYRKYLEIKDNDRWYNKENCKWATRSEQARNRRTPENWRFNPKNKKDAK